eukprot:2140723-Rhodomonas_salina.1
MASPSMSWTLMPLLRWQTSMTTWWQYHLAWLDQLGVRTLRELREVLVPPMHPCPSSLLAEHTHSASTQAGAETHPPHP